MVIFLISAALAGALALLGGSLLQCEFLKVRGLLKGGVYLRSLAYYKKCDKLIQEIKLKN